MTKNTSIQPVVFSDKIKTTKAVILFLLTTLTLPVFAQNDSTESIKAQTATANLVKDPKDSTDSAKDTLSELFLDKGNRFTYLNAGSFDFEEEATPNYLGHLNIFAPNIELGRFGVNCGIMKIDYSNFIDPKETIVKENVQLNPLYPVAVGDPYLLQLNKYSVSFNNKSNSFYIQPLLRLNSQGDSSSTHIYLHLHAEILRTRWIATNTVTTLKEDTLIRDSTQTNFTSRAGIDEDFPFKATISNGYFGIGFTADLRLGKNFRLFFQPTFGYTLGFPDFNSASTILYYNHLPNIEKAQLFYLVRTYFSADISKQTNLTLGFDLRGIAPTTTPQCAAYIGLNLGIGGIIGLLKK